jgi:peptidoglycan-N-acetylmuramic acid deacetylase
VKKILFLLILPSIFFSIEANTNHIIYNGDLSDNKIYLTFDDGYTVENTIEILDVLKYYDVPATFFMEGSFIKYNHSTVRRIADEQTLANHTMCHSDITKLSDYELVLDILEYERLIKEITGNDITKYFRPPMGIINKEKEQILYKKEYKIIYWGVKCYDYNRNYDRGVEYVVKEIVNNTHGGSIILLHTLTDSVPKALPQIIKKLRDNGYVFSKLQDII